MRSRRLRAITFFLPVAALGLVVAPSAEAVHFYRNTDFGCSAEQGAITDDQGESGTVTATVAMLHNTFNDLSNGTAVTTVQEGEAVTWEWNSAHCHSVQLVQGPESFYSGFYYPAPEPEIGPAVAPGVFDFPVPDLSAELSYTHTFNTPGTYVYICEHHGPIGMAGTVVVQ